MTTLTVNQNRFPESAGNKRLPVPVERRRTEHGAAAKAPEGQERRASPDRMVPKRPLMRAAAPFLAQLALQYDGIDAARLARRERKEAAARSYAGTAIQDGHAANCDFRI